MYAARKDAASSLDESEQLCLNAWAVKSSPLCMADQPSRIQSCGAEEMNRTSHNKPSVAVCFLIFNSFRTRDCRYSDSVGAANWRSLTFCSIVL